MRPEYNGAKNVLPASGPRKMREAGSWITGVEVEWSRKTLPGCGPASSGNSFWLFLQRFADFFQRFDVQSLAQGRDLFRLDVAHNIDEHDFILWLNHCDDQPRQCLSAAGLGVNANVFAILLLHVDIAFPTLGARS